ncbi:hypothetical protein [Amycolatopsis sp. MEPSY49]|uniref:hypothetical protein n=1 Tax=Amycolatopsis sp. MEPSY49 TaxID=3151600 RepID=UPI003EF17F8A
MAAAHDSTTGRLLVGEALLNRKEEFNTSLANSYRIHCGGSVHEIEESEDGCFDMLATIARDIYPGYLLPPREDGFGFDPAPVAAIIRHPLHIEFCRAALADESISKIFPEQDPTQINEQNVHDILSFIQLSTGSGMTFQLALLADRLIFTSHRRQLVNQTEGLRDYIRNISQTLTDARNLASGKEVNVPAVVGLADIVMPEINSLTLGQSTLRSFDSTYSKFVPANSTVTTVVTTSLPLKIVSATKWETGSEIHGKPHQEMQKQNEHWQKRVRDSVNLIRFSLLCASDIPIYLASRQESLSILDPFGATPTLFDTSRQFSSPSNTLRTDQAEKVASWHETLSNGLGTLSISVRKLLSALSERLDPVDSLIDSVMTWENMFSGTPETGVRVCASLANLLEPSSTEERTKLFKELKSIYDLRSRLVHGADNDPSFDDVIASRDKAISTALLAIRKVFEIEGFHLKKSSERSNKLILWAV